ncbi:hypothetical protein SAMN05421507_103468 [Lentzea jiangxiensis]|uniref:Uncharacterized protein n=1 Tax=Lentzea jiangxiensis TaxID=641025 RepID=A0A1H0LVG1_9PSEU|nr:hypothetical protein SAMN05421507_103468 [Lentzea jiangxiensis]
MRLPLAQQPVIAPASAIAVSRYDRRGAVPASAARRASDSTNSAHVVTQRTCCYSISAVMPTAST